MKPYIVIATRTKSDAMAKIAASGKKSNKNANFVEQKKPICISVKKSS